MTPVLDPKGATWEPHVGEDYAVVMLPDETTTSASIRVISDDAALPSRVATSLNCHDEMTAALKAVEEWWLTSGMKHFAGAPYAIFAVRAALAKAAERRP